MSLDSASRPAGYRGTHYWGVKLVFLGIGAALCLAGGLFDLLAPDHVITPSGGPREFAIGLVLLAFGTGFAVAFVLFLRKYLRLSHDQRAVYAWAVMQQRESVQDARLINPDSTINDVAILTVATRAKRGELTASEIDALQALRPDVPYPGARPVPLDR